MPKADTSGLIYDLSKTASSGNQAGKPSKPAHNAITTKQRKGITNVKQKPITRPKRDWNKIVSALSYSG
jgi:hypothetical protein